MSNKVFKVASYNRKFDKYLPCQLDYDYIYQSVGLERHIEKRHPECLPYIGMIYSIIAAPDYIGINPNEAGTSFELVKIMDKIGIKLDCKQGYLYVATVHTITNGKLQHGIENGRLKRFSD